MQITTSIDWFAGTASIMAYPPEFPQHSIDAVPQRGYLSAMQFVPDGRRQSVNSGREDMPDHIVYSGKALAWLAPTLTAHDIVRWHVSNAGVDAESREVWLTRHGQYREFRTTRIDLAVDVYGGNFNIGKLASLFKRGKAQTRAQSSRIMRGSDGGVTLYIGHRSSELMLRIYDKAKEQNQTGDWKRIEIEIKGAKARAIGIQVANTSNLPALITGIIAGFCQFPDYPTYQRALDNGATAQVVPGQKKERDTRAWLLNQVVSAIVRLHKEGDEEIMTDILAEVRNKLNTAGNSERKQVNDGTA